MGHFLGMRSCAGESCGQLLYVTSARAPAETHAHIQCVCPALKGARIAVHHSLAGMVFDMVRDAGRGWAVHRELTVAGLQGIPVPEDAMTDWYRMCDELTAHHLMTDAEADP
jgi:hypothetical protein